MYKSTFVLYKISQVRLLSLKSAAHTRLKLVHFHYRYFIVLISNLSAYHVLLSTGIRTDSPINKTSHTRCLIPIPQ